MLKTAAEGNMITWKDPKYGIELHGVVIKLYQNSVLVMLDESMPFRQFDLETHTVVSHKKYKILSVV